MDSSSTQPTFDIGRPSQPSAHHRSRKIIVVLAVLAIVIGLVSIYLQIKERRAYEAYLKSPVGQLEMLERTSDPVTATEAQRAAELSAMEKASGKASVSQEDAVAQLKALEQ